MHVGVEQLLVDRGQRTDLVVSLHDRSAGCGPSSGMFACWAACCILAVSSGKTVTWVVAGPKGIAVMATRFTPRSAKPDSNSYPLPGESLTVM